MSKTEYVVNMNHERDINPNDWREKQGIWLIWVQCKDFLWSPWSSDACGCHLTQAIPPKHPPRLVAHANNVWGFQISDNLAVDARSRLFYRIITLEWVGDYRHQLSMILTWQTGAQTDTAHAEILDMRENISSVMAFLMPAVVSLYCEEFPTSIKGSIDSVWNKLA